MTEHRPPPSSRVAYLRTVRKALAGGAVALGLVLADVQANGVTRAEWAQLVGAYVAGALVVWITPNDHAE
jgi:hypothetical protein